MLGDPSGLPDTDGQTGDSLPTRHNKGEKAENSAVVIQLAIRSKIRKKDA